MFLSGVGSLYDVRKPGELLELLGAELEHDGIGLEGWGYNRRGVAILGAWRQAKSHLPSHTSFEGSRREVSTRYASNNQGK